MSRRKEQQEMPAYGEYQQAAVQTAKKAHKKRGERLFWRFLILLAMVTVLLIVLMESYFKLETVYVIGNEEKSPQQVVTVSGLVRGRNMIGIEEEEVAQAFLKDHTLIFEGLQKEYPGTVYLYVKERKTVAAMQWLGMLYTLDKDGLVMAEKNSATLPAGLPVVTGFNANAVHVGEVLALKDQRQLKAYQKIMHEMAEQLCADQFSEISLADPSNLYLITAEGVTVRAGDASNMQAKIGAVRTTMAYLRQLGKVGGILDVTDPVEPKYMPEN